MTLNDYRETSRFHVEWPLSISYIEFFLENKEADGHTDTDREGESEADQEGSQAEEESVAEEESSAPGTPSVKKDGVRKRKVKGREDTVPGAPSNNGNGFEIVNGPEGEEPKDED